MYNKLFTKILDSSVWLEDHATVRVWFTLIAAMDQDGFAPFASPANLATRARVTLEESQKALQRFMAPDPDSSDPENEGRRVERVPGGFVVLNALKYKELSTREKQREQTKERVKRYRDKQKSPNKQALWLPESNAPVTPSETETETETEEETKDKAFVLPEWMDREAWDCFEDMRRQTRHKLNDPARNLIVKKLVEFESRGHNHTEILNNSVMNGWRGVFEPKTGGNTNGKPNGASKEERGAAALQSVLGASGHTTLEGHWASPIDPGAGNGCGSEGGAHRGPSGGSGVHPAGGTHQGIRPSTRAVPLLPQPRGNAGLSWPD